VTAMHGRLIGMSGIAWCPIMSVARCRTGHFWLGCRMPTHSTRFGRMTRRFRISWCLGEAIGTVC
jgi:hypothetical protein